MKSVHKENPGKNENTEKTEKCVDNETLIKCNACEWEPRLPYKKQPRRRN